MKNFSFILLLLACQSPALSQYYLRGTVTDNHGDKLQYVKIIAKSTGLVYRTDIYGGFGFSSSIAADTLVFSYDGYSTLSKTVKTTESASVTLTALPTFAIFKKSGLSSVIKNRNKKNDWSIAQETYNDINENPFLYTVQSPEIVFAANANRASYSNIRRLINDMDGVVPPDAVRIEEMLNYFNFQYNEPHRDSVFHFNSTATSCPWDSSRRLFFLNLSARKINMQHIPASNLVFLIDASGSMDMPNKLPLIKAGFKLMVKNLRPIDTVSVVVYGNVVHVLLDGVSGIYKDSILSVLNDLTADGPTPGESGIRLAYKVAQKHFIKNGNNRIFLAADGDFNVGISGENELGILVEQQKKSGVYITCLGVGSGNYKDSKLSVLAQRGNGNFAYIDNEQEAEKVLVTELAKTLFTVADNVYLTVAFNSNVVRAYRLIGYDNELTNLKDTARILEGGDVGSGNSIAAVFEWMPVADFKNEGEDIATIQLNYRLPGGNSGYSLVHNCTYSYTSFKDAEINIKKAACVVMFGMKLKNSGYAKTISWKNIQSLSVNNFSKTNFAENEFISLVNKAKKIYTHPRKYRQ